MKSIPPLNKHFTPTKGKDNFACSLILRDMSLINHLQSIVPICTAHTASFPVDIQFLTLHTLHPNQLKSFLKLRGSREEQWMEVLAKWSFWLLVLIQDSPEQESWPGVLATKRTFEKINGVLLFKIPLKIPSLSVTAFTFYSRGSCVLIEVKIVLYGKNLGISHCNLEINWSNK